jgi:hypothetical protein
MHLAEELRSALSRLSPDEVAEIRRKYPLDPPSSEAVDG